jgi:hypothetical protein
MSHISRMCCVGVALLAGLGCSTHSSTIRLTTESSAVAGCTALGSVEGSDLKNRGMLYQGVAANNATVQMREDADKLGANTILVVKSLTDNSGSTQVGEAYRCPETPVAP